MVALYRGVTRPNIRGQDVGWVAQKRGLGLYRARFPSAKSAAEWLAKEMGVPLDSLRRHAASRQVVKKLAPTLLMSEHSGVTWDRGAWKAQVAGRHLGRFKTQIAAARSVAKISRCKIKSLRKAVKLSRMMALRLFRAALRPLGKYCPGDLKSLRSQEVTSKHMFCQELASNRSLQEDSFPVRFVVSDSLPYYTLGFV